MERGRYSSDGTWREAGVDPRRICNGRIRREAQEGLEEDKSLWNMAVASSVISPALVWKVCLLVF